MSICNFTDVTEFEISERILKVHFSLTKVNDTFVVQLKVLNNFHTRSQAEMRHFMKQEKSYPMASKVQLLCIMGRYHRIGRVYRISGEYEEAEGVVTLRRGKTKTLLGKGWVASQSS